MLFSHHLVSELIGKYFEPAWQSVRPVPTLNIDLGNGQKFTRTLHGNVATMILLPSGHVIDIIPGIYDRPTYARRLLEAAALAMVVNGRPAPERRRLLRQYHALQARSFDRGEPPPDRMLAYVDRSWGLQMQQLRDRIGSALAVTSLTNAPDPAGDLAPGRANAASLLEDTRRNELVSRPVIHRKLLESGLATPDDLTRWVYREVLHADLDDPLLGLGPSLAR